MPIEEENRGGRRFVKLFGEFWEVVGPPDNWDQIVAGEFEDDSPEFDTSVIKKFRKDRAYRELLQGDQTGRD